MSESKPKSILTAAILERLCLSIGLGCCFLSVLTGQREFSLFGAGFTLGGFAAFIVYGLGRS